MVLDHTGGFEGLLLVDDDLLGVSGDVSWAPSAAFRYGPIIIFILMRLAIHPS